MPSLSTVFFWCRNVQDMRKFYSDVLGMQEIYSGDDAVSYRVGDLQWFFLKASGRVDVLDEWASQPGYTVGKAEVPSWIVEVEPERFEEIVEDLKSRGVESLGDPREFKGHKQFWIRDPMGTTIEIHGPPKEG